MDFRNDIGGVDEPATDERIDDLIRCIDKIDATERSAPIHDSKTVLVVDDDPGIRKLLTYFLAGEGISVQCAADGAEALECVRAARVPYLMAFIDIQMPRLGGPDTVAAISRLCPETLIVLITGTGDLNAIRKSYREGAYTLLRKPFDLIALRRALPSYRTEAVERWIQTGQARARSRRPVHEKAAEWVQGLLPGRRRPVLNAVAVALFLSIPAVAFLQAGMSMAEALNRQAEKAQSFVDRIEGRLARAEAYLERDEQRELAQPR
jgi:two-component system response regulator (stage 0 sporulation protein F)